MKSAKSSGALATISGPLAPADAVQNPPKEHANDSAIITRRDSAKPSRRVSRRIILFSILVGSTAIAVSAAWKSNRQEPARSKPEPIAAEPLPVVPPPGPVVEPPPVVAITPPAAPAIPPPPAASKNQDRKARLRNGIVRIVDDELELTSNGNGFCWLWFGDPTWTDYDLSLEVQRVRGNDGISVMVRRRTDEYNSPHYLFNMGVFLNRQMTLEWNNNHSRDFKTIASRNGGLRNGEWYAVEVNLRRTKLSAVLDGREILSANDSRYPAGLVGLRTIASQAKFRKFKVSAPDGKVLWEGLPELP
jgi:hypothetical protein